QIRLPDNVQGVFQLVLATNSRDLLFENGATGNNTFTAPEALTIVLPPAPDLQVLGIDEVPATANAGGTLAIDFTVINQGIADARGQWTDTVYLSLKNYLDITALPIGSFTNQAALTPGARYVTQTGDMLVPKRLGG